MKQFAFDTIAEIRRYGYVIGGFADVTDEVSDFENLNRASLAIGVFPIGEDWLPISSDELLIGLARVIGYDSAYETLVVPEAVAKQFAKEFIDVFDKDARFYRSFENEYDASGRFLRGYSTPLTDATLATHSHVSIQFVPEWSSYATRTKRRTKHWTEVLDRHALKW